MNKGVFREGPLTPPAKPKKVWREKNPFPDEAMPFAVVMLISGAGVVVFGLIDFVTWTTFFSLGLIGRLFILGVVCGLPTLLVGYELVEKGE